MSLHIISILSANMSPTGWASPGSLRHWIDEMSSFRSGVPYPRLLGKVPWQTAEQVYCLEMAEPPFDNILEEIDRVLEGGCRYRVPIGPTREAMMIDLTMP